MHGPATSQIELKALSPATGVEVLGVDLRQFLTDGDFARIRTAWEEHCVILLRNQALSEDDQLRFARRFGPLATLAHPERAATSNPAIMLISNIRENGQPIGSLPDGEMHFHSDQCYLEAPATGSLLYAIEIPPRGGNTLFANMFSAYDDLRPDLKVFLAGKSAMHSYNYEYSQAERPSAFKPTDKRHAHPVFRTHPATGRKALYVNRLMTESIVGIPPAQSDEILAELFAHQEQPKYLYEHVWRVGDLIFWDNRSAIHARTDFSAAERRLLRRVTVMGERPS